MLRAYSEYNSRKSQFKMSVSVAAKNSCSGIGEGPHWDEREKSLYYVDVTGRAVHRYSPDTGVDQKIAVGETGRNGFKVPSY